MNVVHLVSGENGGAANAAKRISSALNDTGIESEVFYFLGKNRIEKSRRFIVAQKIARRFNILIMKLCGLEKSSTFAWECAGLDWVKNPVIQNADVVHLHQVNFGLINWHTLKALCKTKKVVWTQHDMWCFTGGCFYEHCEQKYGEGCRNCPLFDNSMGKKLVEYQFNIKKRCLEQNPITIVGCSNWMTECAKSSQITKKCRCVTIPNCVDLGVFRPHSCADIRERFPQLRNKRIVLFGAMNIQDERKGYQYLRDAILHLDPDDYALVIFGENMSDDKLSGFDQICLGYISNQAEMSKVYSGCDVFVAPSLQENLANTVMESLACGTPVTAFRVGGMPDLINHMENGYLAKKCDPRDLAAGIEICCRSKAMRIKARESVVSRFSPAIVAQKYIDLYNDGSDSL